MSNRLRIRAAFPLIAAFAWLTLGGAAQGAADLYIKDTPSDAGLEPNPDAGPMWVTQDIWVRTTPDPGYLPYPFPEASPPWTPLPHENPEYRDPKFSAPNYVYVRVRNRGDAPSTGTERLTVNWAKASTGLSWPVQWGGNGIDYLANNCGPLKVYGAEITKPRKNAADATPAELADYQQAIVAISKSPFLFGSVNYWRKQQEVHRFGPSNRHMTRAFLPWHREFINRYEVLLQEANPKVRLLYWDWTKDPENAPKKAGGTFNFYPGFMGASGRGTGGVAVGAPFDGMFLPPAITRNLSTSTTPPADADTSIVGNADYQLLAADVEQTPNHNSVHGYIGGGGNMSAPSVSAQDPFFFLLHTNVDRLWAKWQRDPSKPARLDPTTTYDPQSGDPNVNGSLAPWDGLGATSIDPWTGAGGYINVKPPKHASVVSPPFYDDAPLTIPILQPGEAVVIQIPWYPPNPADFSCFGADQGHVCLLGRIETATAAPFGMTVAEGSDVGANTRNNNNIAWKNITVVDTFPGLMKLSSILVRNVFKERVVTGLRLAQTEEFGASALGVGRVVVNLKPELFKRWRAATQGRQQGVEIVGATTLRMTSPAVVLPNIPLGPEEAFSIDVGFELNKDYRPVRGLRHKFDLIQTGAPGRPNAIVGGQRFEVNLSKLVLVKTGSKWRFLDDGSNPAAAWTAANFDDSKWKEGHAELGFGNDPATTIDAGPPERRRPTAYFRHRFEVTDASVFRNLFMRLKRNDGAIVYLNGKEIHRVNLPTGAISPRTPATRDVSGLERKAFFPISVPPNLLQKGQNVVAVEVHLASPRSQNMSFDLEVYANPATVRLPPDVNFAVPARGAQFQTGEAIPVNVEALSVDGKVASVALFADGRLIGTREGPPFAFRFEGAGVGSHRLRAVVTADDRQQTATQTSVTVVENLPPTVRLTQPADGAMFRHGDGIAVFAQAADRLGRVVSVEFRLREGDRFDARDQVIGSVQNAPYTVVLPDLAPGHYALIAVARDDRGATGKSNPVHFEVGQH